MTKQKVVKVSLSVLMMVIVVATATTLKLEILDRPGGRPIGTWEGPVEVLAVEGEWAKVRMLGWVPKAQCSGPLNLDTPLRRGSVQGRGRT